MRSAQGQISTGLRAALAHPHDVSSQLGGVLFQGDNTYEIDLSGRLRKDVTEAARQYASGGVPMGTLRYFDEMPLLWLNVTGARNGSLPVAVPRFLTDSSARSFGGPWSLEPLSLEARKSGSRLLRATVTPAETYTPVSYAPQESAEDAPPLLVVRNGTGFEPALETTRDGRFVWILRHGVVIEFAADGLLAAIRSPYGESVVYIHRDHRLVAQQTSDGQQIDIGYSAAGPESIGLLGQQRASYRYSNNLLASVRGDREAWSIGYGRGGHPNRIASDLNRENVLALDHDEKGRLTWAEAGALSVGIEYLGGTNTLRFSSAGIPAVDWMLGPISGPVTRDRAVLLTRSISGRLLQVAIGPVEGLGATRRFIPKQTISLVVP